MAHLAQQDFCLRVKSLFPNFFRRTRVLDVGSLNINGSNRDLFDECAYTGVDIGDGPGVDIVCPAHELQFPKGTFDVIVSTECFEHDRHYPNTLRNIVRMLKVGGLFFFTCASTGRGEHGTARTTPSDSPHTVTIDGWQNYYKNLLEADVRDSIDVDHVFERYEFTYNPMACDLYFWGLRA